MTAQFCFFARLLRPTRLQLFCRLIALLFLFVGGVSFAQTSSVNGHIVDSRGAAIQGAQVTVTSISTKQAETVKTNADGYFLFPPLTPGTYVLRATSAGFAEETVNDVTVEVAGSRTFDLTLKIAGTI